MIWIGAGTMAIGVGAGLALPGTLVGFVPGLSVLALCVLAAIVAPRIVLVLVISGPFVQEAVGSSLLTLALLLVCFIACAARWPRSSSEQRRVATLIGVLAAWSLTTGVLLNERGESTTQIAIAITYACAVAALIALGVDPGGRVVFATLTGWGLVVAWTIYRHPEISAVRTSVVWGENANGAAFIVVVGAVAAIALASGRTRRLVVLLPLALFMLSGALATGSRGALVAAIAALVFRVLGPVMLSGGGRSSLAALSGAAAVLAAAGPAMGWLIERSGRNTAGSEGNVLGRQEALFAALRTAQSHPFEGVGLGNQARHSGLGLRAHNVIAGMSAESGLIAGALFLALVAMAFARGRRMPSSLPLLACVLAAGVALEWWGSSRTGVLAMAAIGVALSAGTAGSASIPQTAPVDQDFSSSPTGARSEKSGGLDRD